MQHEQRYTFSEIKNKIEKEDFPFSGITELGSAYFQFLEPSFYAGTAIHAGTQIREELPDAMEVSAEDRYREEDPFTERFIREFPIQITARYSRFEYDINRDEQTAIYTTPELAWGLNVWKRPLTRQEREQTFAKYREFHALMDIVAAYLLRQNRFGVIFDCHSYNYQRGARMPWHESEKPVVNVGTSAVNRDMFGAIIDDFMDRMRSLSIDGHQISVGENIVFKGGYLSRRLSQQYYHQLLCLAVEFKKIFMDEWSGELYEEVLEQLIEHFSRVALHITDNFDSNIISAPSPLPGGE